MVLSFVAGSPTAQSIHGEGEHGSLPQSYTRRQPSLHLQSVRTPRASLIYTILILATSCQAQLVCSNAQPLLNEATEGVHRVPLPMIGDSTAIVLS